MLGRWLDRLRGRDSTAQIQALLEQGFVAHRAGELETAESRYRRALSRRADHAGALALLGKLLGQRGSHAEACGLLERALELEPGNAETRADLGNVLLALGRGQEAERRYREALSLDAALVPAWRNLGVLLLQAGRWEEAEACFSSALQAAPDDADLHYQRGVALHFAKRAPEALCELEAALHLDPDHADARFQAGVCHLNAQRHDRAIAQLERALELKPDLTKAHRFLGLAQLRCERLEEALDSLETARHFHPDDPETLFALGLAAQKQGRQEAAISCYERVIELDPGYNGAHANLGKIHFDAGRLDRAEKHLRAAIEAVPEAVHGRVECAKLLICRGDVDGAEAELAAALAREPENADVRANLGMAYAMRGEFPRAGAEYDRALRAQPDHAPTHWLRSWTRLAQWDFAGGWDDYQYRFDAGVADRRAVPLPRWDGAWRPGLRLLVAAEQGLGDEIMLASCVPELARRVECCVLECSSRLKALFARSFPGVPVVANDDPKAFDWLHAAPRVDAYIEAGSLPRLLRRAWDAFPRHDGYLRADPSRVQHWRQRLEPLGGNLRVGVAWRGGVPKTRNVIRSLPLDGLAPLASLDGVRLVSLQYGDTSGELREFNLRHGTVQHWPEAIDDYDETAALVSALDVVVSVCSSIVHLTGALGRPVWVMVPAIAEWRYGWRGERMPWYPSARLFRQAQLGDWSSVIQAIHAELAVLKSAAAAGN